MPSVARISEGDGDGGFSPRTAGDVAWIDIFSKRLNH